KVPARQLFQSIEEELEEVDVEGWRAFTLRATLEPMQRIEPLETIHLLPLFDVYTVGMPRKVGPFLSQAYKSRVFRAQGWISAVVLVNGSIQGVWKATTRRLQTVVKVHLFHSPTSVMRRGIEAVAERLGDYFRTSVLLEYEHA
ncbi:MAG: winged helix DNA-binding domain-containing protein, partial [Ktedonobacteraceae bacterium]|nr:winged helix DNA-binding domain-containing protein [Ktedonobacteraceae bacterium]